MQFGGRFTVVRTFSACLVSEWLRLEFDALFFGAPVLTHCQISSRMMLCGAYARVWLLQSFLIKGIVRCSVFSYATSNAAFA